MPVGIFVIFHLFTNMQMVFPGKFQHEVAFIHSMPALLFIEIFGLWLPIGFHALLGIGYMMNWVPNTISYSYRDNWRYTMQRITAWIALVFIFAHVATLRWRLNLWGWHTPFYLDAVNHATGEVIARGDDGEPLALAHASTAMALQSSYAVLAFYIIGVYGVVYHWANGLWTAAISWGLTVSVQAQKRWGGVCAVLGISLGLFSAAAIYGAMSYEPTAQEQAAIAQLAGTDEPNIEVDHPEDHETKSPEDAGTGVSSGH